LEVLGNRHSISLVLLACCAHLEWRRAEMGEPVVNHAVLLPSMALRPFVKRFEVVQSLTDRRHALLPDTSLVACFRLDGVAQIGGIGEVKGGKGAEGVGEASTLPVAVLSGLQGRARVVNHFAGSHVLLTVFTEAGAAAFLREPLDLLFNQTMPMESLMRPGRLNELRERLVEAGDFGRRAALLERFLLRRLGAGAHDPSPDAVAGAAAAHIQRRHGAVRMERLAGAMGLSLSALERRFRRHVGTSPRRFASIVRMRHLLRLRKAGGNLTELALRAGYFDQSHFIHDFRRFTGQAPESFFLGTASFC
jgi:AraC-like DNA-binding protein